MFRNMLGMLLILLFAACGKGEKNGSDDLLPAAGSGSPVSLEIQGLQGILTIQNEDGNQFVISQDGIIDLPGALRENSSNHFTIVEEPCEQRCDVSYENKSKVKILCGPKAWKMATSLDQNISFPDNAAEDPNVVMNKKGDALITWYQTDFFNRHLFKKEYRNREWLEPKNIGEHASLVGFETGYAASAINDDGVSALIWSQSVNSNQLYLGEYDLDVWSFPRNASEMFNLPGTNIEDRPIQVKIDGQGNKLVVWTQKVGGIQQVFKASYQNGIWIKPDSVIDNISVDGTDADLVSLAMNEKGDAVIAWEQSDGYNSQIFKAEVRNGVWTYPTRLSNNISPTGSDAHSPHVAMDRDGNTIITWYQYDATSNGHYQVFKSEYRNGTWKHPTSLSNNVGTTGRHAAYSTVAMNNNGKAVLAYLQKDADDLYVVYTIEYDGSSWKSPTRHSPSGSSAGRASVGMDDQENIVVAWYQKSGSMNHNYMSQYRGGQWKNPVSLADSLDSNGFDPDISPGRPAVAVNNCRASIVWGQQNAFGVNQIYLSEYR